MVSFRDFFEMLTGFMEFYILFDFEMGFVLQIYVVSSGIWRVFMGFNGSLVEY